MHQAIILKRKIHKIFDLMKCENSDIFVINTFYNRKLNLGSRLFYRGRGEIRQKARNYGQNAGAEEWAESGDECDSGINNGERADIASGSRAEIEPVEEIGEELDIGDLAQVAGKNENTDDINRETYEAIPVRILIEQSGIRLLPEDESRALPSFPFQSYSGLLSRAPARLSPDLRTRTNGAAAEATEIV